MSCIAEQARKFPNLIQIRVGDDTADWPETVDAGSPDSPYHYNKATYKAVVRQLETRRLNELFFK